MAESLSQPLAEALVKVKLVYDKSEIKSQTTAAVEDSTKVYKAQIASLKKEARAFGTIGREIGKVANLLLLASGLGAGGLVWKGVKKYMETTEVGAKKLKESLNGLKESWNQFLARIGKVIVESGILEKVISKLKTLLDGMNSDKIKSFLDKAKWTFILGVILKITSEIFKWTKEVLSFTAAMKSINLMHGGAGAVGANAAAGAVGGGVAAGGIGAIYNLQTGGAAKGKILGWFMAEMSLAFNWFRTGLIRLGQSMMYLTKGQGSMAAVGTGIGLGNIWKSITIFGAALADILGKILKFLIVFDILTGVLNAIGFKFKDGLDMIWSAIKTVGYTLELFSHVVAANIEYLIDLLHPNIFGEKGAYQKRLDEDQERSQKRRREIYEKYWGKPGEESGEKEEPFKWKSQGFGSSSFAGLNKAAQDFAGREVEKNLLTRIAKATEATAAKAGGNGGLGNITAGGYTPFADPYTFISNVSGNNVARVTQ